MDVANGLADSAMQTRLAYLAIAFAVSGRRRESVDPDHAVIPVKSALTRDRRADQGHAQTEIILHQEGNPFGMGSPDAFHCVNVVVDPYLGCQSEGTGGNCRVDWVD